ncbi:hypothetical protein [Salinimicrobium flavum]|uniref:Outer membrane efflux protein n=1 Tax=Salinimicrobium flavum TaxID=1737065 RepID=A0ABW5IZS6_9FLAO
MNKKLLILLIIGLPFKGFAQQSLQDSINQLYNRYTELLKTQDSLSELSGKISNLEKEYSSFNDAVKSNNEVIKKLTDKELFSQKQQLTQRRNKIVRTTEFVLAANVSLNAIKQLDATSDFHSQITSLNNPDNKDLGFSLSGEVETVLNEKIIKGQRKVNGVKSDKFIGFVNEIISSPLTEVVTSAIPVVESIRSVIDLVVGTAITGKDISLTDVQELKTSLKVYIEHYEGLAKAQTEFDQNLANLDIRKNALNLLLNQYITERINTLSPNTISTDPDVEAISNNDLINKYYSKNTVEKKVENIITRDAENYNRHLNDDRLLYPNYAINQAKFIRDEIESLGKEYISIYASYQKALEKTLNKSKKIGDDQKIENTIDVLKINLVKVEDNFNQSLNIVQLNQQFNDLLKY